MYAHVHTHTEEELNSPARLKKKSKKKSVKDQKGTAFISVNISLALFSSHSHKSKYFHPTWGLSSRFMTSLSEANFKLMFNIRCVRGKKKKRVKIGFESRFVCIDLLKSKQTFEQMPPLKHEVYFILRQTFQILTSRYFLQHLK